MLKIIKERTPVTTTECYIEFFYKDDPYAGYSFPAVAPGVPQFSAMSPEAIENYKACLENDRLTQAEFTTNTYTYIEPAVGECSCGREVVLECDHAGAVMCECGRWYNLFGQSLKDPKYWEED
jgi:hypothetical protein